MLIAHDSWHSQVIHLPKPYSSTCESMVGKGWKRMRKGETDEETSTLAELWHASTLRWIKMNQEGASGTGKCTVQCTTVDGQKNQTLQTSTSKTPHPKFQCWKKLYLTASVFRVWFFCSPVPSAQPKDNIEIWGCGAWQQYSKGFISSSIYGSTVLVHWVHWVHWPGLSKHLPAHLQAWSPPGNGEGLLSVSVSLSLSLRRLHLWPSRWVSFL